MIRLTSEGGAKVIMYDAGNFNPSTNSNQASFNSYTITHNLGRYVNYVKFSDASDGRIINYWYQVRSFGAPNGHTTFAGNLVYDITLNSFEARLYYYTGGSQNIKAYFFDEAES